MILKQSFAVWRRNSSARGPFPGSNGEIFLFGKIINAPKKFRLTLAYGRFACVHAKSPVKPA